MTLNILSTTFGRFWMYSLTRLRQTWCTTPLHTSRPVDFMPLKSTGIAHAESVIMKADSAEPR